MNNTMIESLLVFLKNTYPHLNFSEAIYIVQLENGHADFLTAPAGCSEVIWAYVNGHYAGEHSGYFKGVRKSETEFAKNIAIAIDQAFEDGRAKGYDEGYKDGHEDGQLAEMENSIIPSDAYDIEVFAVQPSSDHQSGQQAFIGYKFDVDDEPQFHFAQVQFAVPNLQIKNKINDEKIDNKLLKTSSNIAGLSEDDCCKCGSTNFRSCTC